MVATLHQGSAQAGLVSRRILYVAWTRRRFHLSTLWQWRWTNWRVTYSKLTGTFTSSA